MADGMQSPFNIGAHYGVVATRHAGFPALMGDGVALSHGQFWQVVNGLAAHLAADGVGPGGLVALNSRNMVVVLATLMATGLLGAGFVVAGPILARAQVIRPTHFYRTPDLMGHPAVPFRLLQPAWLRTDGLQTADVPPAAVDPDAPWLFLHTSGTTGEPKFIALSQRIVYDRSRAAAADFPLARTTFATFFGCTSRPFFARAMAALLQACTVVEGADTDLWLRHGVNFVAASPMQMFRKLEEGRLPRRVARLEISGSRVPAGSARLYLESFDKVLDVYGASETSKTFANKLQLGPDGMIEIHGQPLDSEVEIVDAMGTRCAPGQAGQVRVRNGYMVSGYLNAPETSARAFRDGWFYPGDIAHWGTNGELVILGRDDDVINLGGYKIQAGLVDAMLCSVPGVREAVAFRNPIPSTKDAMIAFVLYDDPSQRANVNIEILARIDRFIGFGLSERSLRSVTELPRDEDGLPDRVACSEMVLRRARELGEIG